MERYMKRTGIEKSDATPHDASNLEPDRIEVSAGTWVRTSIGEPEEYYRFEPRTRAVARELIAYATSAWSDTHDTYRQ
jgi:hypothetical protein